MIPVGIRNFGRVDVGLYRSGRYSARALTGLHRACELRAVIDLRDRAPLFADRTYQRIGVEFIREPLDEAQLIPEETIARILARLSARPALLHCWKGAHRTGAICALYRLRVQRWTNAEAWTEMQAYGFGRIEAHPQLFASVFGEWRPK